MSLAESQCVIVILTKITLLNFQQNNNAIVILPTHRQLRVVLKFALRTC
jgi:hypothetical protein